MNKTLTFHINNLAYSIEIDGSLEKELVKFLPTNKNLNTQEVLQAYIRKTQEIAALKKDLYTLSEKLPRIDE